MTALTPDPPQDDMPAVQVEKCNSNEYLSRQREEQQREENLPPEREEYLPRERVEYLSREREECLPPECEEHQCEEHLPREREEHLPQEREGQDRERGRVEHVVPECEGEGDIFNADILLDFLKTVGEFNISTPDIETPSTTDAIKSSDPFATNVLPQTPTTTDALIPAPSTHIRREEEVHAIPVSFFKPAIIPAPINIFLRTYRRTNFTRGKKRTQDKESAI